MPPGEAVTLQDFRKDFVSQENRPPTTRSGPGRIVHFVAKEPISLTECLVRHFGVTPEEAKRLLDFGAVYQDRQRVSDDRRLAPGQYIRVHLNPKRFPVEAVDWKATIVHRGKDFLVVNKPAGIPVHANVDNQAENVLHQLRLVLGTEVFVTQRLDTEVSGLIVFAKTPQFQRHFNQLLVDRRVKKRYKALVTSPPEVGRHVHYMEPSERSPKTVSEESRPKWVECVLRVLAVSPASCLVPAPAVFEVEIELETGRTHQIRVQLSTLGSPIIGDKLYGSRTRYEVNGKRHSGIALFSASTAWPDPEGKELSFVLPTPWTSL